MLRKQWVLLFAFSQYLSNPIIFDYFMRAIAVTVNESHPTRQCEHHPDKTSPTWDTNSQFSFE